VFHSGFRKAEPNGCFAVEAEVDVQFEKQAASASTADWTTPATGGVHTRVTAST